MPSWASSHFRKKSMFLCSCSQPEVLGEALFCLSVFSGTVPSLPALFMNLILTLGRERPFIASSFVPAPRPIAWARLPGQAESQVLWLNLSLLGQGQSQPRNQDKQWGPFCSVPCVFPTAASPVSLVFPSAFPYSSALRQTVDSLHQLLDKPHWVARPLDFFLSNFPLNLILR